MAHIYISYTPRDQTFAEYLSERLQEAGIRAVIDSERLRAGLDWCEDVDRAIEDAYAVIVIMSPAAKLSRMLGEFDIRPKQLRIGGEKARGYERADFLDAWKRNLLDSPPEDGTDGTDGTDQVSDGASDQQRTVRTVRTNFSEGGEDGTQGGWATRFPEGDGGPDWKGTA